MRATDAIYVQVRDLARSIRKGSIPHMMMFTQHGYRVGRGFRKIMLSLVHQ
jgi:hypothetical protein